MPPTRTRPPRLPTNLLRLHALESTPKGTQMDKQTYTGIDALAALLAGHTLTDGHFQVTFDNTHIVTSAGNVLTIGTFITNTWTVYEEPDTTEYELRTCLCVDNENSACALIVTATKEHFEAFTTGYTVVKVLKTQHLTI